RRDHLVDWQRIDNRPDKSVVHLKLLTLNYLGAQVCVPESKVSVFPAGLDASKVPAKATEQRPSTYRLAARDFRH
ncbi:MAG: hypothetical protein AB1670_14260, partial [Pseudomonadota bacterium]